MIFIQTMTGVHLDAEDGEWVREVEADFRDLFAAREHAFEAQQREADVHTIVIKHKSGEPIEKWVKVGERWMRTDGSNAELHRES